MSASAIVLGTDNTDVLPRALPMKAGRAARLAGIGPQKTGDALRGMQSDIEAQRRQLL